MDIFSETEIYGVSSYLSTVNLDMDKMKELDATQEYLVRQGNLVNDVFLRMDADTTQTKKSRENIIDSFSESVHH